MPRIAIVTDSGACLPAEIICEHGIIVVPLAIHLDGEVFHDGNVALSDFIERLRTSELYPTTAAPSPGEFLDAFRRARDEAAEAVLCLTLSSRYSGTYSSAARARELAKEEVPGLPVRTVDTGGIAMSHGFAVMAAARAVRDSVTLDEAAAAAEQAGAESNLVGLLDGTRYLAKSGRVPRVLHWAASALGVRPIIASTEGKIGAAGRVRTIEQGIDRLVRFVEERTLANARLRLAVMHAGALEQATELVERVRHAFVPEELLETEFTPAMTVHTGPGFLGLAWQTLEPAGESASGRPAADRRIGDVTVLQDSLGTLPASVERPALVVLSGLPATGKSHLAREIVRRYPLVVLNSDALRKTLVKRPSYSQMESARLFSAIHALIEDLLRRGVPTLLDATNLREAYRRPLRDISERTGARLLMTEVKADEDVIQQRLNARRAREDPADISEATLEVYEMMRREAEPIQGPHLVVDTSDDDLSAALNRIIAELVHIGT